MKNFIGLLILFLCYLRPATANSPHIIRESFNWSESSQEVIIEGQSFDQWSFTGAVFPEEAPGLPFYYATFPVESQGRLSVELVSARYEPLPATRLPSLEELGPQLNFRTEIVNDRGRHFGRLAFVPIVGQGERFERLVEVTLRITLQPAGATLAKLDPNLTFTSVLSDGEVYKIAVSETGMHRISYSFLKDQLGLNPDNIDPRRLSLYGQGGGMLPVPVDEDRIDDLKEIPIEVIGEEDGRFDNGDYILFYGQGADRWTFSASSEAFNMEKNIYDNRNYYFLKVGLANGTRPDDRISLSNTNYTTNTFLDYARFEEDKSNLFHDWEKTQGSGQKWYGDRFKVAREYNYPTLFNFPGLVTDAPVKVRAEAVLRSLTGSRFYVDLNGQSLESSRANSVSILSGERDNEVNYAGLAVINSTVLLMDSEVDIKVRYPYPTPGDDSEGWIDFIQLNARRALNLVGPQLTFRDPETRSYPTSTFQLSGANDNIVVWDITDPLTPYRQTTTLNGNVLNFGVSTENIIREFIAFDPDFSFPAPEAVGRIDNQNLHGLDNLDMVILYHPDFASQAQQLADHRRTHGGLEVALVTIDQVFNEFSSGRLDPTAIRDMAKMLYDRNPRFRYLLLFGDGSFDHKDFYGLGNNFIPVYESEDFNPIYAFPTDDYYALLDNGGVSDPLRGYLNIAVGRLPVKTPQEAADAVNKIIRYETQPVMLRDWRNRLIFVGDDQDNNRHTGDANEIAERLNNRFPYLNLDKVYLDAFPQESTPGGDRFPLANEAINRSIFKGVLVMTYLGHGGPKGWAQERVLNISDILGWNNQDQMPLLVTATCSFTGYDDPAFVTAGEEAFLNRRGGAIALLTTTRAVFATRNAQLTDSTLFNLFRRIDGKIPTLGQAFDIAKNALTGANFSADNSRKFALIGDPALRLAIPEYQVVTTQIDGVDLQSGQTDTLRALQQVTVSGIVTDFTGQPLTNFNGVLYPTIFDKSTVVSTLQQDSDSPAFNFQVQKNVIFKGRASVTNGSFEFSFVVPKDINYQFGPGKISYYSADENNLTDATGSYQNIVIGGTKTDGIADDQGPQVDVFMNTEDFVFGGLTDENPVLLVRLEDDFGINVAGNSIGHDLEGVLDGNTQNTYLLNDFYEAELDDYTRGKVRFPLTNLTEGRHEIKIKAWDVANNSTEGYTEFVVASSAEIALEHVLNYPNPFTDRTCFQFDHNMSGQELDVLVQVFTISGRLVKTIEQNLLDDGAIRLDNCIQWDGRDDYGDRLARGVYLYKVKVRANLPGEQQLSGESEFEKLVILK